MKRKALVLGFCAVLTVNLCACAKKPNPVDPYEKFNRVVFAFNTDIDHLIYRPVAKVYHTVIPSKVQVHVTKVFDNIGELTTMPNDLLQGKPKFVMHDLFRFLINTTFGIGGLFDVASHIGLEPHYNDFGMTLAYWSGKKTSPYLQIPFLGPSTFRDGIGLGVDYVLSPYPYVRPTSINWIAQGVRFVNLRASLLQTDKLVDDAFDPYIFVRNAYLQHRSAGINANMQKKRVGLEQKPSRYRLQSATLPSTDITNGGPENSASHPPSLQGTQ